MFDPRVFLKAGMALAMFFGVRIVAKWRVERRSRAALKEPLVDPILLETTFAPRPGDDPDLLAEVRDTLAHLNRRAYAEEFWGVDAQISDLDKKLPDSVRPTLRRAAVRMLETDDRWLQIVGAKTSATLRAEGAEARLRALAGPSPNDDAVDARLRVEMQRALETLTT